MRPLDIFTNFFDNKINNSPVMVNTGTTISELPDMLLIYFDIFRLKVLSECYMTLSYFLCTVAEY
jgi:hypothetical protein